MSSSAASKLNVDDLEEIPEFVPSVAFASPSQADNSNEFLDESQLQPEDQHFEQYYDDEDYENNWDYDANAASAFEGLRLDDSDEEEDQLDGNRWENFEETTLGAGASTAGEREDADGGGVIAQYEEDEWFEMEGSYFQPMPYTTVLFSMTPFDCLVACFPDRDREELYRILENNKFYLPTTFDELYGIQPEPEEEPNPDELPPALKVLQRPRKRTPCRHFLNGHCARKDCWYSHDLADFACKYYLSSTGCVKGDQCEFLHQGIPDLAPKNLGLATEAEFKAAAADLTSREEFPSLHGTTPTKSQPANNPFHSYDFSRVAQQKSSAPVLESTKRIPKPTPPRKRRMVKVDERELKSRSDSSYSVYSTTRKLAFEQASLRNRFFELAADLFRRGAKAQAARLARRGHEINEFVQCLHAEAAAKILADRNAKTGLLEIDLHGLHPSEAISALEERLQLLWDQRADGTLKVITGAGKHAKGQKSVIAAALESYLTNYGYRYRKGTLATDEAGGMLLVSLT